MIGAELNDWICAGVDSGQTRLAHLAKSLVSRSNDPTGHALDFSTDNAFLEPLLFAYFSVQSPPVPLCQVLFAHLNSDAVVRVCSDTDGTIWLPGFGYLETDCPTKELTIRRSAKTNDRIELSDPANGQVVSHTITPVDRISGTGVELIARRDPLTELLFRDSDGNLQTVSFRPLSKRLLEAINEAFQILSTYVPPYHEVICRVLKRIVLFNHDALNSFATMSAHGTAFLNVSGEESVAFFLEEIVHQAGHSVFDSLTLDRTDLFAVDPDSNLKDFTREAGEDRTIYVALHGAFTECLMCLTLTRCLDHARFEGRIAHELRGRLGLILRRLYLDLQNLNHDGLFRTRGQDLHRLFCHVFDQVYSRVASVVTGMDFRNQPYNFSFERFIERNPDHPNRAREMSWSN